MVVENGYHPVTISSIAGISLISTSTPLSSSVYDLITNKIGQGTAVIAEYISGSVKAITGYFDTLFAKEIYTEKVCVKKSDGTNICLTGDEVETIVNTNHLPLLTPSTINPSNGGPGSSGQTNTSTTTEETATSTGETSTSSSESGTGDGAASVLDPGNVSSSTLDASVVP
jgi:hypothetical protein